MVICLLWRAVGQHVARYPGESADSRLGETATPISSWVSRNETLRHMDVVGGKWLLKRVKDTLAVEGHRVPWCISHLSLRQAQLSELIWSGHSEAIRRALNTLILTFLLPANLGSHAITVLASNPALLNNSLSPDLLSKSQVPDC